MDKPPSRSPNDDDRHAASHLRPAGQAASDNDEMHAALQAMDQLARASVTRWVDVFSRIDRIRELRQQGLAYTDLPYGDLISVRGSVATMQVELSRVGSRLRRVLARNLHADGMSAPDIARVFGVTRQRVTYLLSAAGGSSAPAGARMRPGDYAQAAALDAGRGGATSNRPRGITSPAKDR